MSFSRAFQWYHSHLDPFWPDGTFKLSGGGDFVLSEIVKNENKRIKIYNMAAFNKGFSEGSRVRHCWGYYICFDSMRAFRWTPLLFSTVLWRKHQMTYRLGPLLPGGIFLRPITSTQRFQITSSLENYLFFRVVQIWHSIFLTALKGPSG